MSNEPGRTAESWIEEGNIIYKAGDCSQAIVCYSNALRLNPHFALAFYNRSLVHEQIEDFALAEADRREAFRLDPHLAESWRPIAGAYAAAEVDLGNRAFEQGDFEGALARYEAAIRVDPAFAVAHYVKGIVHHERQELEQALSAYSEAIRLEANLANAYFYRAYIFLSRDDYVRGIDDLDSAIRLKPTDAEYYRTRSLAHAAGGDRAKAESDRKEALRLDPESAEVS